MPDASPNFSPFPFAQLPRLTRAQAAIEGAFARHARGRRGGWRLAKLVGPVKLVGTSRVTGGFDPHAALVEVRLGTRSFAVAASGGIRAIAQRVLGGADERSAPRPATLAEHAVLAMLVAAALEDAQLPGEVWPLSEAARTIHERALEAVAAPAATGLDELVGLALALDVAGVPLTIVCWLPGALILGAPPAFVHDWRFELPIVVARCGLPREALATLAVRDVVVVESGLSLQVGDGAFGLTAVPGAVEATVATGYVRAVATPDEPALPVTVQLGAVRLSLRRLGELAVGEVIGLGRPLAGPYEIHAGGRLIGHGELVDLDGETGVRIVSLEPE